MARTLASSPSEGFGPLGWRGGVAGRDVYVRTLVDLDTGGVAGIEAVTGRVVSDDHAWRPWAGPGRTASLSDDSLSAWSLGAEAPAALLVRGVLATRPETLTPTLGLSLRRIILMFNVAELLTRPVEALDLLVAWKRAGVRVLLDNFSLDDPPARFIEMLPADIVRAAPWNMPWHWDSGRRLQALAELSAFAGNLLMDVAVEGMDDGECRELRRLGIRYALGGWTRDGRCLRMDSGRP